MTGMGHNSGRTPKPAKRAAGDKKRDIEADATDERLLLLLERIERLEEEKKGIADDIRDVFGELKAVGYNAKISRQLLRLRKMSIEQRQEEEMLLETYKAAVGMV